MVAVSDELMKRKLKEARSYTVVVLRRTPKRDEPGADLVVWEHGRRNFELREGGNLRVILPMGKSEEVSGVYVFSTGIEETRQIMEGDPAVKAGIFVCDYHRASGFPEDRLGP